MKSLQIQNQEKLGFRRLARITIDGIRYRLFRSLVTLAVVSTALAFLMNMSSEGLIRKAVGTQVRQELQERRRAVANEPEAGAMVVSLEAFLREPAIRTLMAGHLDVLPSDLTPDTVWTFLESSDSADWLVRSASAAALPAPPCDAPTLTTLARDKAREAVLVNAERLTAEVGTGAFGLGRRTVWLLCVSLLVCGIGITNAMLMSVTERFREIATMKCLGAMDGGIMAIFVLESCVIGLTGGVIGGVIGIVIGTARTLSALGWSLAQLLPLCPLAAATGMALVIGLVLSAVAAVYPAWKAARLAPMEAMRIQ